ncbi:hypothetical protein BC628DRAFT_274704 [Trametes gibbosa]|nr:hypothetical protein BC628DRAFT_274704 [Trametes gibbosa]
MPLKYSVKERAWGTRYDTLDSSPASPPTQHRLSPKPMAYSPTASLAVETPSPRQGWQGSPATEVPNTTPHDTSIFVGSLPTNIEHSEVARRLSEHLSAYAQIKAVKVVRDSRGGVCGFIQCENPAAAGSLLQALSEHPPTPFCGRFLRFEAAKAFRALRLSYRIPTGFVSDHSVDDPFNSPPGLHTTSVKLAHAIRIFRPRNAKHLAISYDADALSFDQTTVDEAQGGANDTFDGGGLLFHPLKYDEKTLQELVSAFGTLETFKACSPDPTDSTHDSSLDSASNSAGMTEGAWEVKWGSREDSVLALLTLRRIPYLTVNWAHHPISPADMRSPYRDSHISPGQWNSTSTQPGYLGLCMRSPVYGQGSPPQARSSRALLTPSFSPTSPHEAPFSHTPGSVSASLSSPGDMSSSPAETDERWADQVTDADVYRASEESNQDTQGSSSTGIPHDNALATSECAQIVPLSEADRAPQDLPLADPITPMLVEEADAPLYGEELLAPHISSGSPDDSQFRVVQPKDDSADMTLLSRRLQDLPGVDPRTVFVGGLNVQDPAEWDEQKLHDIFDQYGNIETIQIIRPLTKKTCFAFIQFLTPISARRAVQQEHNKIHFGRALRVQLRDRNPPPRANWKVGRGRGRPFIGGTTHVHRESHDMMEVRSFGSHGIQGPTTIPTRMSSSSSPATAVPDADSLDVHVANGLRRRPSHDMTARSTSPVSSSTTKVASVHYQSSHGPPSTTTSPSPAVPSPVRPPIMTPIPPHHMNLGYFPPQHWMQPYHPSYAYSIPVVPGYAYPGYPYSHVPTIPPAFVPREASTSCNGLTSSVSNHADKTANINERELPHPLQTQAQPPLRPTGFIQNEQGTLIPVYQRDALDQYMASTHANQAAPSAVSQAPHNVAIPTNNLAAWPVPSYPIYPAPYSVMGQPTTPAPYPVVGQPASNLQHTQGGCWFPAGPSYAAVPHTNALPQNASSQPYPAATLAPGLAPCAPQTPNTHGQPSSGRRGGFHHRQSDRREHNHGYGRGTPYGPQHVRFPDRIGTPYSVGRGC